MRLFWLVVTAFICVQNTNGIRRIRVKNRNSFPIWIETKSDDNKSPPIEIVRLDPRKQITFRIDEKCWANRLWAKVGCDNDGLNCEFGQSEMPCPDGGCQPPSETKVYFYFPPINSSDASHYYINLVS